MDPLIEAIDLISADREKHNFLLHEFVEIYTELTKSGLLLSDKHPRELRVATLTYVLAEKLASILDKEQLDKDTAEALSARLYNWNPTDSFDIGTIGIFQGLLLNLIDPEVEIDQILGELASEVARCGKEHSQQYLSPRETLLAITKQLSDLDNVLEKSIINQINALKKPAYQKIINQYLSPKIEGTHEGLSIFFNPHAADVATIEELKQVKAIQTTLESYAVLKKLYSSLNDRDTPLENLQKIEALLARHTKDCKSFPQFKTIQTLAQDQNMPKAKAQTITPVNTTLLEYQTRVTPYNNRIHALINALRENHPYHLNDPLMNVLQAINDIGGTGKKVSAEAIADDFSYHLKAADNLDSDTLAMLCDTLDAALDVHATCSIRNPNFTQNIQTLETLANKMDDKAAHKPLLRILGHALLTLACILIVVGILAAIPTGGTSLLITAAGAIGLSTATTAGITGTMVGTTGFLGAACQFFSSNKKATRLAGALHTVKEQLPKPPTNRTTEAVSPTAAPAAVETAPSTLTV
jgi:hypothetical protein